MSRQQPRERAPSRKQRYAQQNADQLTLLTPEIRERVLPILESALHDREWNPVCGYARQLFELVHTRLAAYREEFKLSHPNPTESEAEQHADNLRLLGLTMLDCKILMALAFDGLDLHDKCLEFAQDALNTMNDSQLKMRVQSIRDKMVRLLVLKSERQLQLGGARGKVRQLAKENERRWRDLKRYGEETDVDMLSVRALEAHMTGKYGEESRILEQLWRWMHLSYTPKIERFVGVAERVVSETKEDGSGASTVPPALTPEQAQKSNIKSPIVFGDLPPGKYRFWVHAITAEGDVLTSTRVTSNTILVRQAPPQQTETEAAPTEVYWKPIELRFSAKDEDKGAASKDLFRLDDIEWKAPVAWTTLDGASYISLQFQPPAMFQLVHFMDDQLNPLASKSLIDELVQRHLQLYNWNAGMLAERLVTSYRLQNRAGDAKRVQQQLKQFNGAAHVQEEDAENDEARLFPAEAEESEVEEDTDPPTAAL
jgi:hypothetical protein